MRTRRANLRATAVLTLLLALAGTPGCVTTPPRPTPGAAAAAEAFRTTLADARTEGRREVDDILGVYANLPAEQAPGITAFRRDVAEALAALKRAGRERLTVEEVDRLTVANPHFWNAWFEFDPRDSSLLMLHASLLMEAGELFRASLVLTVGVQALPLNVQERVFWLTQQARTHFTAFRRLDELREQEKAWGGRRSAREAGLGAMLREWPADGFTLEALLQSRIGMRPGQTANDDGPIALDAKQRKRVAWELAQLRRANPVAAVRYAEDRTAAAEFGRLWARITDESAATESRELVRFAALAQQLRLGELALVSGRAVAARRGFLAPADLAFARDSLALVLPPPEAAALAARLESGQLPSFRLTRPPEPPTEVLQGMDPALHPLLADHAVREFARETLWIQAAGGNIALRAQHLRTRALGSSNIGRYTAALADLDEALRLKPKTLPWLVDRAVILSRMGNIEAADTLFAQLRAAAPQDEFLRSSLAVHAFGVGRHAEAETLFRAGKPDDDNRAYEVIFGYLAGLRRGQADRAWLQAQRSTEARWPAPIQRFLLGEIDRAALLQAARDPFDLRTTEQQCEAYFALGEVALARGDTETAVREFENCVQSGIVGFIEYDLARRELARLRPAAVESPAPDAAAPAAPSPGSDHERPSRDGDDADGSPV